MVGSVEQAVREKVGGAEIERDPFPHLIIPDLLPEEFFRQLAETIPLDAFEAKDDAKSNLPVKDGDEHFEAAPEEFRTAWRQFRDDVVRETIAPILVDRLRVDIWEKFASLFSPEVADEMMAGGFTSKSGRIMARRPGYSLGPHSDAAHFAVTCLLYFTNADDADTGALCLYRPERRPELLTTSTYYPTKAEGIAVELVKEIPTRENLFVAFVNGPESLHSAGVSPGSKLSGPRLAYQTHLCHVRDLFEDIDRRLDQITDPAARRRWQRYVDERDWKIRKREKKAEKTEAAPPPPSKG
jgi:hypothetical protein